MPSRTAVLSVTIGIFVVLFGQRIVNGIRRRRLGSTYGAAPAARWLTWDPLFGTDVAFKIFKWTKEGQRSRQMAKVANDRNHSAQVMFRSNHWIWTTDPQNVKAVLASDVSSYSVAFRAGVDTVKLIGLGTFNVDGERWLHARHIMKPTFNRAHLTDAGIKKHFDLFLSLLPRDGSTVQAADLLANMGTDVGAEFIFGESTHTLRPDQAEEGEKFQQAFIYANVGLMRTTMLGRWAIFYRDPKIDESIAAVHKYVDGCIARAAERKEKMGPRQAGERNVLVYDLLDSIEDRVDLRHELLHIFFGATETIGIVMTNILFDVARNPHVWARLREELQGVQADELVFEKLKSLKYLQWTIKESLRLHPPAPTTMRQAVKPTVLPAGGGPDGSKPVAVIPGDMVSLNWAGVHRRRDIYGDDAEEFRPERWEHLRMTFEYQPFAGGPRVCPGQQVALFWVAYTLARLVLEIKEVKNRDERLEYVDEAGLSCRSRYGAKVAFVWA
ncbi:cytochrome p450 domain-containing protein [Sarocladium implicatum]|nr:cytochrome p450 domain-containing protein [Sarocladium implicatum]